MVTPNMLRTCDETDFSEIFKFRFVTAVYLKNVIHRSNKQDHSTLAHVFLNYHFQPKI